MKNVIVLFGKPGAGKGTRLSEFLEGKENSFDVLSVGNLLRKAKKDQTELGKLAATYMDSGELVPDDIINGITIEALKNTTKPIFTDGFPRTVGQATAMLEAGIEPAVVIEFYVDDEVVLERSRNRIVCDSCNETYTLSDFKPPKVEGICDKCGGTLSKRADDDEDVVKERLEVYQTKTYPTLEVFKKANVPTVTINNEDAETGCKQFAQLMSTLFS